MVQTFEKNYSRNQALEHLRLGTSLLVEEVVVQDTVADSHLTLHHAHWSQHLYYLMMARVELLLVVLYRQEESAQLMVSVVVVFDLHQLPLSFLQMVS